MLTGPKFARVSYTLFSVAILMALLKLGGITGVKPFVLRTAPATPVAQAAEPVPGENLMGASLDLPERKYTLGGRLLPGLTSRQEEENREATPEAPVFYRPAPARGADEGGSKTSGSGEPVCGDLGDFPRSSRVVFPLPETYFDSYEDTWGAARPQGGHEGTDLMSPAETPEFAITDGELVPVSGSNENGWNRLGGYTMMLEAAYDVGPIKKGDLFYYAHLNEESTLPIGTKVRAGQKIGFAGDTGEGREGTRGKFPSHLHFGWYDTGSASDRTDLESGAMNPYPLLLWLEENGGSVAGRMDAAYCEAPQGPDPPADEDSQPAGSGTSPDLDTGDADDARPTPVVEESRQDHSPTRQREPDTAKGPDTPTGRLNPPDKDPDAKPVGDTKEQDETDGDESSAPGSDAPSGGEDRVSDPPDDGSPGAKGREEVLPLLSEPRLGRASRPSYASILAELLRAPSPEDDAGQDDASPVEKEDQPPDPPEKEPEASEPDQPEPTKPKDRPRPKPREPEKDDEPSSACDPPEKVEERQEARVTRDRIAGREAPIERDEWLALVDKDPELRACETAGAGEKPRRKALAVWTGHPDRDEVRFYLRDGKVMVEDPDEPTLEKARKIADALNAKVKDDDGE